MKRVFIAEISFAGYLTFTFLFQALMEQSEGWVNVFWNISTTILTILLCITFWHLRHLQKKVSVIFCNAWLLKAHEACFIIGSGFNLLTGIL